jgi:hypothetical protein
MEKSKVLDKIQKCLRLSKSPNANEAAAALRQAQKLMAAHGISEEDITLAGYASAAVDCPIQVNRKYVPHILLKLVDLMKKAFAVQAVIDHNLRVSDYSYQIRYFGPTTRVHMAEYAHQVVYRAMEASWRQFLKENPYLRGEKGARTSFQLGWLHEVSSKVEAIGFTEEEEHATTALKKAHYGKQLEKVSGQKQSIDQGVAFAGQLAAKEFSIHRPMDEQKLRLEKL